MLYERYFETIAGLIHKLHESQGPAIEQAAQMVADCIAGGGVIHVFGSGHSHMMAEEVYHRAGGLMAVDAMLDPNLTSFGLLNAGALERTEGYAKVVLATYDVRPGEVVIVVSNSGINPVPIEMAIEGQARGARVIAITSAAQYAAVASRHSSGKKLTDVADLVVDSLVPTGDATLELQSGKIGAASTVMGAALMNAIMVEAAALMEQSGSEPPVIVSMNVPGGDERNKHLEERYRPRLRLLRG